jgi:hypothetical protein
MRDGDANMVETLEKNTAILDATEVMSSDMAEMAMIVVVNTAILDTTEVMSSDMAEMAMIVVVNTAILDTTEEMIDMIVLIVAIYTMIDANLPVRVEPRQGMTQSLQRSK